MGKILPDGTVISVNTVPKNKIHHRNKYNEVYKGIIVKVNYTDDSENSSPFMVTYEVEFIEGLLRGLRRKGVVDATTQLSGPFNFTEIIRTPAEKTVLGLNPTDFQDITEVAMGDIVLIAFKNGDLEKPEIIGCSFNRLFSKGATKEDGIRILSEFNGVEWNINKDGELIITYRGGQRQVPKFGTIYQTERPDTAPTEIKINKDGVFSLIDKENQELKVDRVNKKITIEQSTGTLPDEGSASSGDSKLVNSLEFDKEGKKITTLIQSDDKDAIKVELDGTATKSTRTVGPESEVIEEIDGAAEKMTLTFKSGLVITVDGAGDKVEIVTTGGAKLSVDGTGDAIEAEDSAGGKLKISAGKVGLGAPSAELLDQFSQSLEKTATWATSTGAVHTHTGNLGYPTAPTDLSAQYIQLGTDLLAIKALIDAIKGGI